MDIQVILYRAPSAYEITIKSHYEIWKQEKAESEPKFVIENIRHPHDPQWRERYFSISCIADVNSGKCAAIGPTILWTVVGWLFASAPFAWFALNMAAAYIR